MNKKELIELIESGREIEFSYNNKRFSITYGTINGKEVISFCEYNKDSTEVECVEELLSVERYGITLEEMIGSITEEHIWVF